MAKMLEDRGAYLAVLLLKTQPVNDSAHGISRDVAQLRAATRSLEKLAVAACNYELSPRQERRREALQSEIAALAEQYGMRAETSGDPRGYVVKLFDPLNERAGDGWGGGWPVY